MYKNIYTYKGKEKYSIDINNINKAINGISGMPGLLVYIYYLNIILLEGFIIHTDVYPS